MIDYDRILIGEYLTSNTPAECTWSLIGINGDSHAGIRHNISSQNVQSIQSLAGYDGKITRHPVLTLSWDETNPATDWTWRTLLDAFEQQTPIMCQFDILLSRNVTKVTAIGSDFRNFKTPTFPIVPVDYESGTMDWTGHVFINMSPVPVDDFEVEPNTGVLTLKLGAVGVSDTVSMKYQWRAEIYVVGFESMRLEDHYPDQYKVQVIALPTLSAPTEVTYSVLD